MPSPLGFLWAGIGVGVVGRWSMTSLNHWFRRCMVCKTLAICELTSALIVTEMMWIWFVISLWRSLISSLKILVRSFFMSLMICAQRDWVLKVCEAEELADFLDC